MIGLLLIALVATGGLAVHYAYLWRRSQWAYKMLFVHEHRKEQVTLKGGPCDGQTHEVGVGIRTLSIPVSAWRELVYERPRELHFRDGPPPKPIPPPPMRVSKGGVLS